MEATPLVFSPRSRAKLSAEEMEQLKAYVKEEFAPYANIHANTKVSRTTILKVIEFGYSEQSVITKLKGFLAALKIQR